MSRETYYINKIRRRELELEVCKEEIAGLKKMLADAQSKGKSEEEPAPKKKAKKKSKKKSEPKEITDEE